MKKHILSLLAMFLLTPIAQINAQESFKCGTIDQQTMLERITANRAYHAQNPSLLDSRVPQYIPIKFNLLADFDGSGRIRISSVLDQLCSLNEDYAPFEVIFYLDNNGSVDEPDYFTFLDNRGAYLDPRTNPSIEYLIDQKDPNSVNVYIIDEAGSSGATQSGGFYTPFGDYIVLPKNSVTSDAVALTHEAGHFFSLAHPHTGWEDTGWGNADPNVFNPVYAYGTTITATTVQSAQSAQITVELVNRSNCENAGDRICDTPSDFGFGPHTAGCIFSQKVYDRNLEEVHPMENNIMGYFNCSDYEFTSDQVEAVKADFLSPSRSHLRSSYVPQVTDPITAPIVVNSPVNAATSDYYNSVEFSWDPVPNATDYLVEISDVSGNITAYMTRNTAILVEDLEPNGTYLWFVQPFNEVSSCSKSATFFLFTNDATTGTNDIELLEDFKLIPNPVSNLSDLKISLNSQSSYTQAAIELIDLAGNKITDMMIDIQKGLNIIKLPNADLSSGLYIVKLTTEDGVATEQLVVR